jgi:hypothetical protein
LAYLHISVFAYLRDEQNHEALLENTKDTIQKKLFLKVLLRISVFVFEPKKSVLRFFFFLIFFSHATGAGQIETRIEPLPLAASYRPLWSKSRGD